MAAVVVQGSAGFGADTTSSCVLTRPTVASGDLMVVAHVSDPDGTIGAMTAPAGWAMIVQRSLTDGCHFKLYTKTATGSEPTTYTFPDSTGADASAGMVVFRGHNAGAPFNASVAFQDTASLSTTLTAPSVTGVVDGVLLTIHAAGAGDPPNVNAARSFTPPSGMTERVDSNNGGEATWVALGMFTQPLASASATGSKSATISGSRMAICASVVIKPDASAPIPGAPTATAMAFSASLVGGKRLARTVTASAMALSSSPAGKKIGVGAPAATDLTLAGGLAQGGKYVEADVEAEPMALDASAKGTFVRHLEATALTLGATRTGFKIGVGDVVAEDELLDDAHLDDTFKTGVGIPTAPLALEASLGDVDKTGGDPVLVTWPPLPPLEQPLRLIAQDILTKTWLDWDLPVNDVEITHTLSGPCLIRGTFKPEIKSVRELGLDAWATWIHAEIDGEIRASGILMPVDFNEEEMSFEAVGFTVFADGTPYLGTEYAVLMEDPLDIVRHMWTHLQNFPESALGITVDNTTTPIELGEPAYLEPQLDEDGDQETEETEYGSEDEPDYPGSKNVPVLVQQDTVSTTVWNRIVAAGYEPQLAKNKKVVAYPTEYAYNVARGVSRGIGTSTIKSVRLVEQKPYSLMWWDLVDIGGETATLAQAVPFDYYEKSFWNADKTEVRQHLGLAYPRMGVKRLDLRFAQGENIRDVVQVAEGEDTYSSAVIVIGAGEGRDAIRGYAGERYAKRLRRVTSISKKNIKTVQAANELATAELLSRRGKMLAIAEITIDAIHPNAKLGEYQTGDDILVQVDIPWVGEVAVWHRILSYSYRTDRDLVTLKLARTDSFRYGSTI